MPAVLFVNTRRSPLEVNASALAAHRLGLDVLLLTDRPTAIAPELAAEVRVVDTYDQAAATAAADELAARHDLRGVITWAERDVALVSALAARFGLPGLPARAARTVRNKFLMREALAGAGRSDLMPAYARVHDAPSLAAAARRIGFPAILKPTSASGSRGIHRIERTEDLDAEYRTLDAYTRPERDPIFGSHPGELIYEELLGGTEHSVEGLMVGQELRIVGITDKWVLPEYATEFLKIHPTCLPPEQQETLAELTRATVRAAGLRDCAFHLECRLLPDGSARLLEIAGRIGGGYITSHLIPLSTGVDFYAAAIAVAVGLAPDLTARGTTHAGSRQVISPRAGVFAGFGGLNQALELPGVEHIALDQPIGAKVALPPEDYLSRVLGSVIGRRGSYQAVAQLLEQAVGLLEPRFDDEPRPADEPRSADAEQE